MSSSRLAFIIGICYPEGPSGWLPGCHPFLLPLCHPFRMPSAHVFIQHLLNLIFDRQWTCKNGPKSQSFFLHSLLCVGDAIHHHPPPTPAKKKEEIVSRFLKNTINFEKCSKEIKCTVKLTKINYLCLFGPLMIALYVKVA